jgi:hypothetical protein
MGYLIVEGFDGTPLPQIAAKTYNADPSGGTFGQNLFVFRARDLIEEGFKGYIPGVAVSASNNEGFRTNIGMLNTDDLNWTEVRMTVLNEGGEVIGDVADLWLEPGEFKQFNLAERANLPREDVDVSVKIEVLQNGPIAAYASTVDNRTQDPILIPAVPDITQVR